MVIKSVKKEFLCWFFIQLSKQILIINWKLFNSRKQIFLNYIDKYLLTVYKWHLINDSLTVHKFLLNHIILNCYSLTGLKAH